MLNELNSLMGISSVKTEVEVQTVKISDTSESSLMDHPSYDAGFEAGLNVERQSTPYTIDPNDPIHMRAFAAGYNDGLRESNI